MYAFLLGLPVFFILLYFIRRDSFKRGQAEREKDEMQGALDDLHIVQNARNRLKSVDAADVALRDKLSKKYTRD